MTKQIIWTRTVEGQALAKMFVERLNTQPGLRLCLYCGDELSPRQVAEGGEMCAQCGANKNPEPMEEER